MLHLRSIPLDAAKVLLDELRSRTMEDGIVVGNNVHMVTGVRLLDRLAACLTAVSGVLLAQPQ